MKLLLIVFLSLIAYSGAFSQLKDYPPDYPKDLPKPKITQAYPSTKMDSGLIFRLETDKDVVDAMKYFQNEMPKHGFKIEGDPIYTHSNTNAEAEWKKINREVTVTITSMGPGKSSISILYN